MSSRDRTLECIVLRSRESPAGARIAVLMTRDEGLDDVFIFGGPKNRLRSLASPFVHGRAFIYSDPVKGYRTLKDFEVLESFTGLRESLDRLSGATAIAECLLVTSGGGGEFPQVTDLSLEALRALDTATPGSTDYVVPLYLWRLLGLMGLGPDLSECTGCGAPLGRETGRRNPSAGAGASWEGAQDPLPGLRVRSPGGALPAAWYPSGGEGFLCPSCAEGAGRGSGRQDTAGYGDVRIEESTAALPLSMGALAWLRRAERLPFDAALGAGLDRASLEGMRKIVVALARRGTDMPLSSLTGM